MGFQKLLEKMKDYKIEKKLGTTFKVTLAMMFVSIAVCIVGLIYVSTSFTNFYNYYHAVSTNTLDSRMCVQGAVKSVAITLLTDDEASIERFQTSAADYSARLLANLTELQEIYKGDPSLLDEIVAVSKTTASSRQKLNEYLDAGDKEAALDVYMNEYGPSATIVQNNMEAIDDEAVTLAAQAYKTTTTVDKLALAAAVAVSIAALITTAKLSSGLIKMLKQPIEEVEKAAKEMAAGSLNVTLDYVSEDEFGSLASSMRSLCENTSTIILDIEYILGELSHGNFRVTSKDVKRYVRDYEPILTAMRALRDRLNETLINVNEAAERVAEGSVHLSEGAQALAEGSMEQAGAVEELTATVEDVSSMAEDNAKNAEDAYKKVAAAEKEADESQQNLYDLTQAMQVINDTSLKIQNIIAAIEDIASQTNLLSLNASIEAARAGEAGRGFAVVADQIGKLAADSASSAVDTKKLIEESMEEVRRGSEITQKTVDGIEAVLASMKVFEEVSKNSSETSRKQADMLNQIEAGIEQISTTVQSNSAAAEETSATSEELSAQADYLKNEINKFQLI